MASITASRDAKIVTEHDVLKWLTTAITAVVIPLMLGLVWSMSAKFDKLAESHQSLAIEVATLKGQLSQHHKYITGEFEATKSQLNEAWHSLKGLERSTADLVSQTGKPSKVTRDKHGHKVQE